jgi:eukaryotic-like serine/threonine-protein kinase
MADVAGASLGKYTLLAKLATGGMAEIFAAKRAGGEVVVVKRILPQYAENQQFVQMFLDEARVASRIRHRNVCQVFELGRLGRQYFIAMELLEGVTLARLISRAAKSGRRIDLAIALGVITQACEGLHFAHELKGFDGRPAQLVHRDISPQNLFITTEGVVKVLDFGIAKTQSNQAKTRTGTLKGKSGYMSPEQVRGNQLDRRSDVFSLAVVAYETLTCRRLFTRDNEFHTYDAILNGTIPELTTTRHDVPPPVSRAVLTGLARSLTERAESCKAFAEGLAQAVGPGGIGTSSQIRVLIERMFGPEIETQRKTLHDALSDLPTDQIAFGKRPTGISQISGILLDDLGDIGATLLDDLVPIDLAMPADHKPTVNERKTPPQATPAVTPAPNRLVYSPPSTSTPTIPVARDAPSKPIATGVAADRSTWVGLVAIIVAVIVMLSAVVFVIISRMRAGDIPTIAPTGGSSSFQPADVPAQAADAAEATPPDAGPADALPAATGDAQAAPGSAHPPAKPPRKKPPK